MRRTKRSGFSLVELLVVIGIIAFLAAISLPALNWAREAGRVTQCRNNLHQLGTAVQLFHDQYNKMPPYYGVVQANLLDKNPTNYENAKQSVFGSWFVHLLPYMGNENLWDAINGDIKEKGISFGEPFAIVRTDKQKVADAEAGRASYIAGSSGTTITEQVQDTVTINKYTGPEYLNQWVEGDQTVTQISMGGGYQWVGHTEEEEFIEVKNEGYWDKQKVKDGYWTSEEVNRIWNKVLESSKSTSGYIAGTLGHDVQYSLTHTTQVFNPGGLNNFHKFAFINLLCPSDPTITEDGLAPPVSTLRIPRKRATDKHLYNLVNLVKQGRWGTTSYMANWNAWTDGKSCADQLESNDGAKPYYRGAVNFEAIVDGTSNTIMFGEGYSQCDSIPRIAFVEAAYFHMFGINFYFYGNTYMYQPHPAVDKCNNYRAQSGHLHMNVCMVDGSVKAISRNISNAERSYAEMAAGKDVAPNPSRLALPGEEEIRQKLLNDGSPHDPLYKDEYRTWERLMLPRDGQGLDIEDGDLL